MFKKDRSKNRTINWLSCYLQLKKELEVECVNQYTGIAKANNKYMKNYDKNIESSYLMYLHANNLYGWEMSQKLPVNGFKWLNDHQDLMKTS